MSFKKIIIVGSGPVGGLLAVLMTKLVNSENIPVDVYEKREKYVREYLIKIDKNLFYNAQECYDIAGEDSFFYELDKELHQNEGSIKINHLEERFKKQALKLGAKYIMKNIQELNQLYERSENAKYKHSELLILDCAGKNSELRKNTLGDKGAMVPIKDVIYANLTGEVSYCPNWRDKFFCSVNTPEFQLVTFLSKKSKDSNLADLAIHAIPTDTFSKIFEEKYPNTRKYPLKLFSFDTPREIFYPIAALLRPLFQNRCTVDLNSIVVKKIETSCGYAKVRSKENYICFGEASAFLTDYRSTNFAIKDVLNFIKKLRVYLRISPESSINLELNLEYLERRFREDVSTLHLGRVAKTHKIYPYKTDQETKQKTNRYYFWVTQGVIGFYGIFLYDIYSHRIKRITAFARESGLELQRLELEGKSQDEIKTWLQESFKSAAMKAGIGILHPIESYPSEKYDIKLIETKILWHALFSYNECTREIERHVSAYGTYKHEVKPLVKEKAKNLPSWEDLLAEFNKESGKHFNKELAAIQAKNNELKWLAFAVNSSISQQVFMEAANDRIFYNKKIDLIRDYINVDNLDINTTRESVFTSIKQKCGHDIADKTMLKSCLFFTCQQNPSGSKVSEPDPASCEITANK